MNKSKTINSKLPFIKWLTSKNEKKFEKPTLKTTTILVNGKLITCILLSIISGIIDLVFFSGLSKSAYDLFGFIAIPAGLLLSLMSIGFTMGKFFCAMQLGAISELKTRLHNTGYKWYKNLNKLSWKWHTIHKFLIGVSILTSISLSVVSIGTGVSRNANKLKQIDELITEGTRYNEILNTARDTSLTATVSKSVDTSEQDAITYTQNHMSRIRPVVEQYKQDRQAFTRAGFDVNSSEEITWNNLTIIPSKYWDQRNEEVNNLLQNAGYGTISGRQIYDLNLNNVQTVIRRNYLNNYQSRNPEEIKREMEEARQSTIREAQGWLDTLNASNFTKNERVDLPNGRYEYTAIPVTFDTDYTNTDTKVLITRALSLLKQYRTEVESDNGDIGSSSKLFMMIGNALDKLNTKQANSFDDALTMKVNTGMSSTEIMIMIVIMLFGIVQEFLIALFTPKSTISRKMLYQFDSYFGADFSIDNFLLDVYIDYYKKGILTKDDFEAKCRKCVDLMQNTRESIIERYSKKPIDKKKGKIVLTEKQPEIVKNNISENKAINDSSFMKNNHYSSKVTDAVNEIENLLKG